MRSDDTEKRFQCFSTGHIADALTIRGVFYFFLGCQVTNRVDENNNLVSFLNVLKFLDQVEFQLFNMFDWQMQDARIVNTVSGKIFWGDTKLRVIEQANRVF